MTPARRESDERPRYADSSIPDNMNKEQRCLAEAVYFEARSEPEEGQAAVAQVVLNRMKSGLYPSSICGVVYQNRHRHLACQFTFACEGKSLRITDRTRGSRQAGSPARSSKARPTWPTSAGDPLPCRLRPAVLGQAPEENGRDRPAHLLQAPARADLSDLDAGALARPAAPSVRGIRTVLMSRNYTFAFWNLGTFG